MCLGLIYRYLIFYCKEPKNLQMPTLLMHTKEMESLAKAASTLNCGPPLVRPAWHATIFINFVFFYRFKDIVSHDGTHYDYNPCSEYLDSNCDEDTLVNFLHLKIMTMYACYFTDCSDRNDDSNHYSGIVLVRPSADFRPFSTDFRPL